MLNKILTTLNKTATIIILIGSIIITLAVNIYQTKSNTLNIEKLDKKMCNIETKIVEGTITRTELKIELKNLKEYMGSEMNEVKELVKEMNK